MNQRGYRAAGAVIDPVKPSSVQALHRFAQEGNAAIVEDLVQAGVDVNHPTPLGVTPLEIALQFAQPDMAVARILINAGANIRADCAITVDGLVGAATRDHADIAQALMTAGTDINAKDTHGRTAVHMAARAGSQQTLELLLANPALDMTVELDEHTALEVALTNDHAAAAAALLGHHDTDPNVALIWAQTQPAVMVLLLQRAGIDRLETADDHIRLLTFCADHRPRLGQPNLELLADTNRQLGTLLARAPLGNGHRDLAVARLTLAFEQELQARGAYHLPMHRQIAAALLEADPAAADFAIGQALMPRSELENMAKSEVYYARRETNALLEHDLADIAQRGVTANVHQPGLAKIEIEALELLQQRDHLRDPKITLDEVKDKVLILLEPQSALINAADRIAAQLQKLEPDNTDRIKKIDFATKEKIRVWISAQPTEERENLSRVWQLRLARYGLEHALTHIEPVNENGLAIATPEVLRLLMADQASRPELHENLKAAFTQRLVDIGGDPDPCNVGCAGRLLTTQLRVVPELMDGAPDPKMLPAEFNDIAMRVSRRFDEELEQAQAGEHKENEMAALHENAAAIKHDRFARTAEMLLRLRGLPPDSVHEHIATIKEGFKQEMY